MRSRRLTNTSYAVLGLLTLRSWTTYELTKQIHRSLHHLWPRAESNLYGAAEGLSQHGLAVASSEHRGRRPRTVYTVTPRGRRALRRWLAAPGTGPVLEFEALLKVFYADQGTKSDLLGQLQTVRAWLDDSDKVGAALMQEYLEGAGPFPGRLAVIALVNRFFWDHGTAIRDWTDWAEREVSRWPEEPGLWPNNTAMLRKALGPYLDRIHTTR